MSRIVGVIMIVVGCFFLLEYSVEGRRFSGDRSCYVGLALWGIGTMWLMLGQDNTKKGL